MSITFVLNIVARNNRRRDGAVLRVAAAAVPIAHVRPAQQRCDEASHGQEQAAGVFAAKMG